MSSRLARFIALPVKEERLPPPHPPRPKDASGKRNHVLVLERSHREATVDALHREVDEIVEEHTALVCRERAIVRGEQGEELDSAEVQLGNEAPVRECISVSALTVRGAQRYRSRAA